MRAVYGLWNREELQKWKKLQLYSNKNKVLSVYSAYGKSLVFAVRELLEAGQDVEGIRTKKVS